MIYKRLIQLNNLLSQKSHFLFGPRQVGKSTAIEQQLPDAYVIDLLDSDRFTTFLRRPKALGEEPPQIAGFPFTIMGWLSFAVALWSYFTVYNAERTNHVLVATQSNV